MDDVEGRAREDRLVEGDREGSQGGLGAVDADDDPVQAWCLGSLVADHEHGTARVGDDLHRHGADAGPAEHPVAHGAHDDQGRGAGGVDESLAGIAVPRGRRHRKRRVDRMGVRGGRGEQAPGVRRDDRVVGQRTETEHGKVGGEGVQQMEGHATGAGDLGAAPHRGHGEGGSVHPDDDSGPTHTVRSDPVLPGDGPSLHGAR